MGRNSELASPSITDDEKKQNLLLDKRDIREKDQKRGKRGRESARTILTSGAVKKTTKSCLETEILLNLEKEILKIARKGDQRNR